MKIGLGIGIPFIRNYISSLFNPSKLFTGSTNGVWYDPSDINLTWRRNLLTYSEQFDNAAWDKTSFPVTVTADAIAAPNGTNTADLVVPTAASAGHAVRQTGLSVGTSTSFSVYAKSAGYDRVQLYLQNVGGFGHITFSLASGTVTNAVSGTVTVTGSITSAGNGWYLLSVAGTGATAVSTVGISPLDAGANGATLVPTYTGNGTSGIYIWGAQLELGSTATPYQRITDGIQDYLQYQAQPVLYRDAAGTLPVTAVEQPVGLMLDKSKGLVLGPELVTNGTFDSSINGWTTNSNGSGSSVWIENSGNGAAKITNISGQATQFSQALAVTAGKTYQITANITYISGSISGNVSVRTSINASTSSNLGGQTLNAATNTGVSFYYLALSTTTVYVSSLAFTSACSYSLDNISVRELPGNHAFNGSGNSANFPVLSARVNLLEKTEDLSNAYWTSTGIATRTVAGALTTSTEDASTGVHRIIKNSLLPLNPIGTPCTISCVFKAGTRRYVQLQFDNGVQGVGCVVDTNVQPMTATALTGAGTITTVSVEDLGGGEYRVSVTGYYNSGTGTVNIVIYGLANSTQNNVSYTGNGSTIIAGKIDFRVANDALGQPTYQRVNTSTDYDTVGFKPYLRFNGTNQWLQTNSIDFTYGDKMFVSAGVRKLSDAATGVAFELSANTSANAGAIQFVAPGSGGTDKYRITASGSILTSAGAATTSATYNAPVTNVASGLASISTDQQELRLNGASAATKADDLGTGNFGNYPLYIGARAGTSLWFNGRLYSLIVAGKLANAVEITETEKYVNSKTAAY